MKKIITTFATCLLAAQISTAWAEESKRTTAAAAIEVPADVEELISADVATEQADIDEQNSLSDSSTKDITPQTLEDFFDEFAEQHSISYGEGKDGKVFFTGRASVTLPATDPSFAKALNLALDTGMLNLQAEFVR